jgi:hypothetical protein
LSLFGAYCLVQGLVLVRSDDFLVSALGVALLLWLPGCVYYVWRLRATFATTAASPRKFPVATPANAYADVDVVAR